MEYRKINCAKRRRLYCYWARKIGNSTKDTKLIVILVIEAGYPRLLDEEEGSVDRPRRLIKI